ncbi:MAG TPA: hypothetical protein DCE42_27030 [Myxococcales bacterium]|nr:hypothetical protein [Deltaproteobacteria bacterium]HAA58447.1 hypothetical protein [Myxococcales bacterium]
MSKLSEQTMNQAKNADYVGSSLQSQRTILVDGLSASLGGLSKAEWEKVIDVFYQHLDGANHTLVQKEQAYVAEQTDDTPSRDQRDADLADCQDIVVKVRDRLFSIGGEMLAKEFGLPSAVPQRPDKLAKIAASAAKLLYAQKQDFVDEFNETTSPQKLAAALEAKAKVLDASLKKVQQEVRELQSALVQREQARENWDKAYKGVSRIAEGLFFLADNPELAERVRYTVRRSSGKDKTPEENQETPTTQPS